jgi:hypothetical protein
MLLPPIHILKIAHKVQLFKRTPDGHLSTKESQARLGIYKNNKLKEKILQDRLS